MGKDGSRRRAEVGAELSAVAEPKRRLIYGRRQGRPLKVQARDALETVLPRLALPLDSLGDPLSLFPFRRFGHYNEAGNRVVADTVLKGMRAPELRTRSAASTNVLSEIQASAAMRAPHQLTIVKSAGR